MTQELILKSMNLSDNTTSKKYAGYICKVFDLLTKQKKNIIAATVTEPGAEFFIEGPEKKVLLSDKIKVTTTVGEYQFQIPTGNEFYNDVCKVIGLPYSETTIDPTSIKQSIELPKNILSVIKKAALFTSNDDLRPAMTCVLLNFENDKLEVVSTNAHYIFLSEPVKCNSGKKRLQLMIDKDGIKKLKSLKYKAETFTVDIISDKQIIIAGVPITLTIDLEYHRYPDYKVVVAKYKQKVKFDRSLMEANIKRVLPMANRCTNQVNFSLNGNIKLSTQDVDYSFESGLEMPHLGKDFKDTTIGMNGKFVLDALSVFKEKEIAMYTEGEPNRMTIFSNGKDRVGVMPLILND